VCSSAGAATLLKSAAVWMADTMAQRFKRVASGIDAHDATAAMKSQSKAFLSIRRLSLIEKAGAAKLEHQDTKPHLPDYPRAWFYPELPWGAPVTMFPQGRLRGQGLLLYWECFTLCFVLYISFEVPYRAGYALDTFPACTVLWRQVSKIMSCAIFPNKRLWRGL
jgi:hypothetical protein